jgi:exodeoxyribonuclease VII small subunit
MSPRKKNKEIRYQDAVSELENIVQAIEEDELDIDKLSDEVKRALELIQYCRTKLRTTEDDIQKAFADDDEDETDT